MGQQQSAVSAQEAPSTTCPGRTCIASGPLDEHCDYDRLWLELKSGLRTDFVKDPFVKHGDVEDFSEDEFVITKTFHGEKMGLPVDVKFKSWFFLDKDKGEIYEEVRELATDGIVNIRILRTLRDPLRLELLSHRFKEEERRAGPIVQVVLATLLKAILKRDVIVAPFIPSRLIPQPGLLSASSQPLDDCTNFEDLVSGIREHCETQAHNPFAKDVKMGKVREIGVKSMFDVIATHDGAKAVQAGLANGEPKDFAYCTRVECARVNFEGAGAGESRAADEKGIFVLLTSDHATRQPMEILRVCVHQAPLTVEAWACNPVGHEFDPDQMQKAIVALTMNGYLNVLMERLEKL